MAIYQRTERYRPYYRRTTLGKRLWSFVRLLVAWFVLYQLITTFLISSYTIESVSMEPALRPGDRILVSRIAYGPVLPFSQRRLPGIREPERGDIVVLTPPYYREAPLTEKILGPVIGFFSAHHVRPVFRTRQVWEHPLVVKRVIGLPGDTVRLTNNMAYVKPAGTDRFTNETALSGSPYTPASGAMPAHWDASFPLSGTLPDRVLGPDEYFVIGDNRLVSSDSRHWGTVSLESITGRVVARYWPVGRHGDS